MVFRLYSDRLKDQARSGEVEVYQYTSASTKLRNQIKQIVQSAFGKLVRHSVSMTQNPCATFVRDTFCRSHGIDNLGGSKDFALSDVLYAIEKRNFNDFIDLLELIFIAIQNSRNLYNYRDAWGASDPTDAIEELNFRLRDDGLGFQFAGGHLIRVDSQLLHSEAVKPALILLAKKGFEGPQMEFLDAFTQYKAGNHKQAITEAAKAFESMMKAVCDKRGWVYAHGARASDLVKVLRANKLWPDYLDGSFDQLLATLSSGLPKVRNEEGAHGQGAAPKIVPAYVAAYALHLAAAKIVLIGEAAA